MTLAFVKERMLARREEIASLVGGFLLTFAPLGEVHPFGIALLCASEKCRPTLLLGCLAALPFCRTGRGALSVCLFACYGLLYVAEHRLSGLRGKALPALLSALLSDKKAEKPASERVRCLLAGGSSLCMTAWSALAGSSLPDVLFLGVQTLAIPLFCLLFCRFLGRGRLYEPAAAGVAFALVQVLHPFVLAGVPLALLPGAILTLCIARNKGFAYGCAAGLLCGLTAGGASVGALGVAGITYGLLVSGAELPSLALAYMISVSGYWYLAGTERAIPAALLLLVAFVAFLPLRSRVPMKAPPTASPVEVKELRLEKYAAAFSSLSGLFYTVSENASPRTVDETVKGIRTVVQAFCRNCEGCDLEEGELCNCFVDRMREQGIVHVQDLPLHIVRRCPSIRAMARTVNRLPTLREQECEKGIRRMASEYANLSSLLDYAAKREESARVKDRAAAAKVREALRGMKISFENVQVTGTRLRVVEVFGVCLSGISASSARICATLSELLGVTLSEPEFRLHGDYAVMRLTAVPRLRVEYAKCVSSKSGEKVCGDTASFFETEDGLFYCLLSDGMGSGRDAALSSRLAALMLEKLLTVGAEKADALQMLNKALRQKDKEVFATVDLLEIDRYTGMATLIKAGAAPTLLFRNGSCRRFESKTPPAGIMRDVIAEKRTFPVRKGDLLVLLSDGVLQTGDEPGFRMRLPAGNAHSAANGILSDARARTGGADDMSVCAIKVS